MKQCCTCKQELEFAAFYSSKTTKDGWQRQCKLCKKAANKAEFNALRCKKYRQNNPEKAKKSSEAWRQNNPKHAIEYYHRHEDKQKFYDRGAKYIKNRYATDPDYRILINLKSQVGSYLKGKVKKERTIKLLGYTIEDFVQTCGRGDKDQQIDHKIPITWFKKDTPVHIMWNLQNLQWVDPTTNRTKGNRYADPIPESYLQIALPHIKENFANYFRN